MIRKNGYSRKKGAKEWAKQTGENLDDVIKRVYHVADNPDFYIGNKRYLNNAMQE